MIHNVIVLLRIDLRRALFSRIDLQGKGLQRYESVTKGQHLRATRPPHGAGQACQVLMVDAKPGSSSAPAAKLYISLPIQHLVLKVNMKYTTFTDLPAILRQVACHSTT